MFFVRSLAAPTISTKAYSRCGSGYVPRLLIPSRHHPILSRRVFATSSSNASFLLEDDNGDSSSTPSQPSEPAPPHPQLLASSANNFDTYRLVQRLEQEGFDRAQAEAIVSSLSEVIHDSIQTILQTMVTKTEQEKNMHQTRVDFRSLRNTIAHLASHDLSLLKSDVSRLHEEITKLRNSMKDDMNRLASGVRLDLNLEKARIRDEANGQVGKVREADARIEAEIGGLRTQLQTLKFEIVRNVVGTITAGGGLILAYVRFLT